GRHEEAAALFRRAYSAALREGALIGVFFALEHLALLEVERGRWLEAEVLCDELRRLGEKIGEGSEHALAEALAVLCRIATGKGALSDLEPALAGLRRVDAKYRLTVVLLESAGIALERGELERARDYAGEALGLA